MVADSVGDWLEWLSLSWSSSSELQPKNSFCSNQNIFEKTPKITEKKLRLKKVNFTDRENLEYYLGKLKKKSKFKFWFGFGSFLDSKSLVSTCKWALLLENGRKLGIFQYNYVIFVKILNFQSWKQHFETNYNVD